MSLESTEAAVVVPPELVVNNFADLQLNPQLGAVPRRSCDVEALLKCASLWARARIPGPPLAGSRRVGVVRALTAHIFAAIGGQRWAKAEAVCHQGSDLAALKRYIAPAKRKAGFGSAVEELCVELAEKPPAERIEPLRELAVRFEILDRPDMQRRVVSRSRGVVRTRRVRRVGPQHADWLVEFALRLASAPGGVHRWADKHLTAAIEQLFKVPELARAARFAVLAVTLRRASEAKPGVSYAGWEWPTCDS
jgi:hypothetical protein